MTTLFIVIIILSVAIFLLLLTISVLLSSLNKTKNNLGSAIGMLKKSREDYLALNSMCEQQEIIRSLVFKSLQQSDDFYVPLNKSADFFKAKLKKKNQKN